LKLQLRSYLFDFTLNFTIIKNRLKKPKY